MKVKYIVAGVLFLAYCYWQYSKDGDDNYMLLGGATLGALAVYVTKARKEAQK